MTTPKTFMGYPVVEVSELLRTHPSHMSASIDGVPVTAASLIAPGADDPLVIFGDFNEAYGPLPAQIVDDAQFAAWKDAKARSLGAVEVFGGRFSQTAIFKIVEEFDDGTKLTAVMATPLSSRIFEAEAFVTKEPIEDAEIGILVETWEELRDMHAELRSPPC